MTHQLPITPQALHSDNAPVLVLGATGSFAGAVTAELLKRGVRVRALVRSKQKLIDRFGQPELLDIIEGDVQSLVDLNKAAQGCKTIVHGVNYLYHQWFPHMETATNNVIATAGKNDALIVFPGNVYSLGAAQEHPFTETSPHNPVSRKGELRQWMEEELKSYADQGGRVLIIRAGDYFGPTARNGYLDPLFGGAAKDKSMLALGNLGLSHQWAYVPDLARATVDLMEISADLLPYEIVNFEGTVVASQRKFMSDIARVAGSRDKVNRAPWFILKIVSLFDPLIREVMEMKYLFESTVLIEGPRFQELLPGFQATAHDEAIRQTIDSYRVEESSAVALNPATEPA
jgi:nucleoside-diphosphate-sugar epimerase